jgi:hypothetical protein
MSLPSAVTLPYTYKSVPSSLPPSVIAETGTGEKPRYVVSSSGHASRPEEIIASCKALQEHIEQSRSEAAKNIKAWEDGVKERELAEKRRVAPGWLDRDEKLLKPTKANKAEHQQNLLDSAGKSDCSSSMAPAIAPTSEGEELDRAFGKLSAK